MKRRTLFGFICAACLGAVFAFAHGTFEEGGKRHGWEIVERSISAVGNFWREITSTPIDQKNPKLTILAEPAPGYPKSCGLDPLTKLGCCRVGERVWVQFYDPGLAEAQDGGWVRFNLTCKLDHST